MYNNHAEYLRKPAIARKPCWKNLVILHMSVIISKKVQRYQYLSKYLQHKSNKDQTQKLNVANKVLATKEDSEYHFTKKYICLHKQLQVDTIAHLLIPLYQCEEQAHNEYIFTTWCSNYYSKLTAYFITIRFTN